MEILGTPNEEFMAKISSESVSNVSTFILFFIILFALGFTPVLSNIDLLCALWETASLVFYFSL